MPKISNVEFSTIALLAKAYSKTQHDEKRNEWYGTDKDITEHVLLKEFLPWLKRLTPEGKKYKGEQKEVKNIPRLF